MDSEASCGAPCDKIALHLQGTGGKMSTVNVKCAFCGKQDLPSKMYRCSKEELWVCYMCTKSPGVFEIKGLKCPRCGRELQAPPK